MDFSIKNIFKNMKKLEALTAIENKSVEEVSAEEITALNNELTDKGVKCIEVAIAGTNAKAMQDLATKVNELETANNTITTVKAEKTTLEEKLGKLAGAEVKELSPKEDKIKDEESNEFNFDESPSAKVMKKIFG